jgi:hypothetical protein
MSEEKHQISLNLLKIVAETARFVKRRGNIFSGCPAWRQKVMFTIIGELAKRVFSPPSSLRAQRKTLSF